MNTINAITMQSHSKQITITCPTCRKLFRDYAYHERVCCSKACAQPVWFGNPTKRFFEAFKAIGDCWIWQRSMTSRGYGFLNVDGKKTPAHRFSFEIHYSAIPKTVQVLHRCDVRACVNPEHLFLGNNNDNRQDSVEKRRHVFGERQPTSKMTDEQIIEIRALYAIHITQRAIADLYGIVNQTVSEIVRRKTWKHVS